MKAFIFKMAVVVVLTAFTFGFFAFKDNKPACAAYCPYYCLCVDWYSVAMEKLEWAFNNMVSWFQSAIKNLIEFFKQKMEAADKIEKAMKTISQQERLADVAVAKQKTNIKEALAFAKKTIAFQRSQVDTLARRFPAPSDEVCKDVGARVRVIVAEREAEFETRVMRERDRVRNAATTRGNLYYGTNRGFASSAVYGPIVRRRALYESGAGFYCYADADLGNHQGGEFGCGWDSQTTDLWADWPRSPSLLIEPITEDQNQLGMRVMQELILPPSVSGPISKAVRTDTLTQDAYVDSVESIAAQNLNEEVIRRFVGNITTKYDYDPGNFTSCEEDMNFVKEVVSRKYGLRDARPGGVYRCPSSSELKWAETMATVNTGYLATSSTALDGNLHQAQLNTTTLEHKLAFEEIDSYRSFLLQNAIGATSNRNTSAGQTPIDSIGR